MAGGRGLPPGITNSGPVQVGGQVQLFGDTGAPDAGIGDDGSFYFRADPADAGASLFVKVAGAWVQLSIGGAGSGIAGFPAEWLNPTTLQAAGAAVSRLRLGPQAQATADGAIAIGGFVAGVDGGARALAVNAIAIGAGGGGADTPPLVFGSSGIAIGIGTQAGNVAAESGCIAIGRQALARAASFHIAIGEGASAQGGAAGGIAIGFAAQTSSGQQASIAIGRNSIAGFDGDSIALGRAARAEGLRTIAIGQGATSGPTVNTDGIAIGTGANLTVAATDGVAIGRLASSTALNGVAIGQGALADVANLAHIASDVFFLGRGVTRNKVLGTRVAGWAAATGTATRTTFATSTVTLAVLAEHVKALLDDLGLGAASPQHGLIGA